MKRIAGTLTVLIFTLSVLAVYLSLNGVTDRLSIAEENAAKSDVATAQANAKVDALATQVRALGETPVVTAPVSPQLRYVPVPGPRGPRGFDGVSITGPQGGVGAAGTNGTDGANGADGKDGADGRGIASATCGDDGRWTITYTDGATADGGVCREPVVVP